MAHEINRGVPSVAYPGSLPLAGHWGSWRDCNGWGNGVLRVVPNLESSVFGMLPPQEGRRHVCLLCDPRKWVQCCEAFLGSPGWSNTSSTGPLPSLLAGSGTLCSPHCPPDQSAAAHHPQAMADPISRVQHLLPPTPPTLAAWLSGRWVAAKMAVLAGSLAKHVCGWWAESPSSPCCREQCCHCADSERQCSSGKQHTELTAL